MRGIGPLVSVGGHAAFLLWGLVSFAPEPLEADFSEALPVEFVTISEVRDLTKGVRDEKEIIKSEETVKSPDNARGEISKTPGPAEKPVEEARPVPVDNQEERAVEKTPEPALPEPTPNITEPKEVVEAPLAPKPPLAPPERQQKVPETAKPEPEVVKPDPVEESEPVEEKDPLADLINEVEEENTPEEVEKQIETTQQTENQQETVQPAPPSAPAPRLNPRPKTKTAAVRPDLLDKKKAATNAGGRPPKKASLGTKTGRQGAKLTQTELDGLRDAIQRCWALPPGYSAGQDFSAKVKTRLTRDGRVDGRVQIISVNGFQGGPSLLVKNAVKVAIEKCQPYKLPAGKYAEWQNLEVTFYP